MEKNKNLTTIIFDLGGVIIDLDWKGCIRNFEKIGVLNMENLVSTTVQKGFILDYELGNISSDAFRAAVREFAVREVTDEEINHAWTSLLVSIPEEKYRLLTELKKKYRVLMLSNTNELSFQSCLYRFFNVNGKTIDDYFDKCYLSYQMRLAKPFPEIFEALLKSEGVKAEECLFLDDGTHNIETAKQLGFQTEFIKPYSSISEWELLNNVTMSPHRKPNF